VNYSQRGIILSLTFLCGEGDSQSLQRGAEAPLSPYPRPDFTNSKTAQKPASNGALVYMLS